MCTALAVITSPLATIGGRLNLTNWRAKIPAIQDRRRLWLSFLWNTHQLCGELLHESLVAHAVLVHHVLHREFFVEKVGICCSNVQEVIKEFLVPLHSCVLCCVILDQLV